MTCGTSNPGAGAETAPPETRYGVIYTDPPWPQKKGNTRKCRPAQGKELDYQTMSVKDCFSVQDQFFDLAAEKHNIKQTLEQITNLGR